MKRFTVTLVALLSALVFVTPAPAAAAAPDEVRTDKGWIKGTSTETERKFLGVPFAAPPTGTSRWRPPRPAAPWTGVRPATQPEKWCAQSGFDASTDEDCLYLNVYTPPAGPTGLPVLVWFHGGGYLTGKATIYDGVELAKRANAVVVTTNYRLGVFGFLAHPGLRVEDRLGNGNYGIMDQQAALQWVRNNIEAFGGNRNNVTIFGESAGGGSVCTHMVAPSSAGLFHRAIVQSGACIHQDLTVSELNGLDFADDLECDYPLNPAAALACMRGKGAGELLAEVALDPFDTLLLTYKPSFGAGSLLPERWDTAIANGRHNKVPVVLGTTLHEGRVFVHYILPQPIDAATYSGLLFLLFQFDGDDVEREYPGSAYGGDYRLALSAAVTDSFFACPASGLATALTTAPAPRPSTRFYEFADQNAPVLPGIPPADWLGAYHGSELPYLFTWPGVTFTPEQQTLSNQMVGYWAEFARRGDPNGTGRPNWPAFTSGGRNVLNLEPNNIVPRTDFDARHKCAFWAGIQ